MGLVYEEKAEFGKAQKFYKRIGIQNKFYVDAYIRLANLELKRGNYPKALYICDEEINILRKAPENVKSNYEQIVCFKGSILMELGEFEKAKRIFDSLKHNIYARLSNLSCTYEISTQFRDEQLKQSKFHPPHLIPLENYLKQILHESQEITKQYLNNFMIANMVGVGLAERGYTRPAK